VLFQFAAFTLTAATAYKVRASVSSGASAVNLYRDSTAGNWSRMLRQSTNVGAAGPTTGDVLYVMGELTGTSGTNSFTVTMDSTSTNQLGGVSISTRGTLTYGTSASTAYYLKTIGNQASTAGLIVYSGGTLQIGTSGTPIPSSSSAVLELGAASDGQYGLTVKNGATLTTYGATVSTIATTLAADVAANASSFVTAVSTGWASGDVVVIASTTRTAGDTEQITLGTVTTTTCNVSVGGGSGGTTVKNAHSGTGATAGEVIHLTRNVKIRNASSSFGAYVDLKGTSTVSCSYTEFYYLGANVSTQRGIEIETTTGSCTLDKCSVHDCRNFGLYLNTSSGSATVTNGCFYNLDSVAAASTQSIVALATSGAHTFSGNYVLGCTSGSNQHCVYWQDIGSTFNTNTIAGCSPSSSALDLEEAGAVGTTMSGCVLHSNIGSVAVRSNGSGQVLLLSGWTVWRNSNAGFGAGNPYQRVTFAACTFFGNSGSHIQQNNGETILDSCTLNGDSTFSTADGIQVQGTGHIYLRACSLGATTAHTQADIWMTSNAFGTTTLWNTTLGSSTQVGFNNTGATPYYAVRAHKLGGVATSYKCWYPGGTIAADQTTRHTASGYSWKMTPTSSSQYALRLPGPGVMDTFRIPVTANTTVTLSCYMLKDASFNGSAPTLTIVGGVIAGVGSAGTDITTTATLSSTNTWYQVTSSSVTPTEDGAIEFRIECNGTAGNLYVDDFALS
jgi:hypothetical protein